MKSKEVENNGREAHETEEQEQAEGDSLTRDWLTDRALKEVESEGHNVSMAAWLRL